MIKRASGADEATRLDFNALYRGDFDSWNCNELVKSTGLGLDLIPWDIDEPQPVLRELERSGQIRSEVLDTGCGLGDNALFLAERGYRVFGIDIASIAIERAQAQAQSRGLDVEFAVADATTLRGYEGRFATVIDCGLYHGLTEQQRKTYLTAVHHACQPAARLHVIGNSTAALDCPGENRISETNLRDTFALVPGWVIRSFERTVLTSAFTHQYVGARSAAQGIFGLSTELGFDQHGRLLIPAWLATAERL